MSKRSALLGLSAGITATILAWLIFGKEGSPFQRLTKQEWWPLYLPKVQGGR